MAQYPGVPWNQRPDYLALTQRVDPAGIVTTYNPPRPGVSATDVTSFVYGQATITINNWPEVMYYLNPTPEWTAFRSTAKPQQKVDANGQGMFERFPRPGQPARPLLDFPILPDTICSQEELWWIELWRRMDPRIHWQDILMRIEIPNRTEPSDKLLQNSTNNLINRHEHRRYFMLAWHSTGANGMKSNQVRTMVMARVNAAHPPLPPNSTRGLTPGLINPLLGNVAGNVIAHPPLRNNQGRLRVGGGRPQVTQAAAAANQAQGNLAQGNPAQAPSVQNNQGRNNRKPAHRVSRKHNRASPDHKGRPSKRQAQALNNHIEEDDMDTRSDGTKSSEDKPLLVAEARAPAAKTQKSGKPTFAAGKMKAGVVKKKPSSQNAARVKKTKQLTAYQQLKEAQQVQQDSTTDYDPEDNAEDSEGGNSPAGALYFEGDPGFEAAYQASRRGRRQAQDIRHAPRHPPPRGPPRRHSSTYPPTRHASQDAVSDSELLGDIEAQPSDTPPAHPANTPNPAPRQVVSAITGLPFAGQHRRPEALSGYGDSQIRRRGPRSSRFVPSASARITEENNWGAVVTRNSNAASTGLPIAPENLLRQSYYRLAPDGSYYHYTDGSELPTYVTYPIPSSNSRVGFTPNQRAHGPAQTNVQPPHMGDIAQPVGPPTLIGSMRYATDTDTTRQTIQTPADALNGRGNLTATDPMNRLTEVAARLNNSVIIEMQRREQWSREEWSRHTRALSDAMGGNDTEYVTGFLEREMERERRERQPSSDDE